MRFEWGKSKTRSLRLEERKGSKVVRMRVLPRRTTGESPEKSP